MESKNSRWMNAATMKNVGKHYEQRTHAYACPYGLQLPNSPTVNHISASMLPANCEFCFRPGYGFSFFAHTYRSYITSRFQSMKNIVHPTILPLLEKLNKIGVDAQIGNLVQPVNSTMSYDQSLNDSKERIVSSSEAFFSAVEKELCKTDIIQKLEFLVEQSLYLYNFSFEVLRFIAILKNPISYSEKIYHQDDVDVKELRASSCNINNLQLFFQKKSIEQLTKRLQSRSFSFATSSNAVTNPFAATDELVISSDSTGSLPSIKRSQDLLTTGDNTSSSCIQDNNIDSSNEVDELQEDLQNGDDDGEVDECIVKHSTKDKSKSRKRKNKKRFLSDD